MSLGEKVRSILEGTRDFLIYRLPPNALALAAVSETAERMPTMSGASEFLLNTGVVAGFILGNKYGPGLINSVADRVSSPIQNMSPKRRLLLKGGAATAALGLSGYALFERGANVVKDLGRLFSDDKPSTGTEPTGSGTPERTGTPEGTISTGTYDPNQPLTGPRSGDHLRELGYEERVAVNFPGVRLTTKYSIDGRIQRTLRWKPFTDAVEQRYGMPEGYMMGLIMQEGFGDPMQPNGSNDGGIGLIHTQGTTAKRLGLEIYGTSNTDADNAHGRALAQMFATCNMDFACIAEQDDRAHPLKNIDAIARYVRQGYEHARSRGKSEARSWQLGATWVRGPAFSKALGGENVGTRTASRKRRGRAYLGHVEEFRSSILNEDRVEQAGRAFDQLNQARGHTFADYINTFQRAAENFDLAKYIAQRPR